MSKCYDVLSVEEGKVLGREIALVLEIKTQLMTCLWTCICIIVSKMGNPSSPLRGHTNV